MSSYGIDKEHLFILDYPVREFTSHRQDILDDMIKIGNRLNPDYVFAPSLNDVHQDHHVIAEEAIRAFKKTTLFAYEVPWNNLQFNNQFVNAHSKHYDYGITDILLQNRKRNGIPGVFRNFDISNHFPYFWYLWNSSCS